MAVREPALTLGIEEAYLLVGRATGAVAAEPPDLILLDVMMPVMDGLATCRALKGADVTRLQSEAARGMLAQLRAQIIRNPVTGESYLLLDLPTDAPPPMALGFTPDRLYVPSMPSPPRPVNALQP